MTRLAAADALSVEYEPPGPDDAAIASHYAYTVNGLSCPGGCLLCKRLVIAAERQARPHAAPPPWSNGD